MSTGSSSPQVPVGGRAPKANSPNGGGPRPPDASRLIRGGVVLVVAVVVAVAVLARMGSSPTTAASSTHHKTTATTSKVAVPTSTTVPRTTSPTTLSPTTTTTLVPSLAPSSVLVLVLNGWQTEHAALFYKNQLAPEGYDLRAPADAATDDNTVSEVFYVHPQYEPNATAIAKQLGLPSTAVLAPTATNDSALTATDLAAADVIVLVAEDISGKVPAGYNG